jgi:hypothetical protein
MSMEFGRVRSALPWVAAALSLAWIATVLPALPFPYCNKPLDEVPRWCHSILIQGVKAGTLTGGLGWAAWAKATGAMTDVDLRFVPLTARAWLPDAMNWGGLLGFLAAASLPPWVPCVPALFSRRGTTDPALIVAGGWSIVLAVRFVGVVGTQLLHPNPSVLMLPPLRAGTAEFHAPLSAWCPYSVHARARECETARDDARRNAAYASGGFGFAGARCVPLAEHAPSSSRLDAVGRVSQALERILAGRATVRRDHSISIDRVDVAAVGPDGNVLLAVDVTEDAVARDHDPRTARLGTAGVAEYWRIAMHPNRDPVTPDMLHVAKLRDAATGRYTSYAASSRDPDARLGLAALPDVRIPIAEVMPSASCDPRPAVPTADCQNVAFVVDGSIPSPTLVFADQDGDGIATRLQFTATSEPMPPGFDPTLTGVAIRIRAKYPEENIVDAVIPAGPRWARSGDRDSAWTYRDPDGHVAGLTLLSVSAVAGHRATWELHGARGRYRTRGDAGRWAIIGVGIAPRADGDPPCSTLFFPVTPSHCEEDEAGSLTCTGPRPAAPCSANEPDGFIQCALEEVAHAEEVFFARKGSYFAGSCANFLDTELPQGVTCLATSTGLGFGVSAIHRGMSYRAGCRLQSPPKKGEAPMRCS